MISLWQKVNHLVHNPKCRCSESIIVEWSDVRSQPTQVELDAVSDQEVIDKINELPNKKAADVAALGTRSEMQAEAAAANSIPALRDLVLKLAEIVYSNENGTID